jgi:hypothetical protein
MPLAAVRPNYARCARSALISGEAITPPWSPSVHDGRLSQLLRPALWTTIRLQQSIHARARGFVAQSGSVVSESLSLSCPEKVSSSGGHLFN